ncbi:hypothetical protein BC831DRAFT_448702 [Entophlyctis helioformis]|nr:hypothetical protein BC831DRAFT_448702 [Entophlyctis helioformis]
MAATFKDEELHTAVPQSPAHTMVSFSGDAADGAAPAPSVTSQTFPAHSSSSAESDMALSIEAAWPKGSFLEHLSHKLQFMTTDTTHLVVVGMSTLDLLLCLISAFEVYYDPASPAAASDSNHLVNVLNTNMAVFTALRTALFWSSAGLRMAFLFEVAMRLVAYGPSLFFSDLFDIADAIVVLLAFTLKFALYARDALVLGMIIALRIGRLWKVLAAMEQKMIIIAQQEMARLEDNMRGQIDKERRRGQKLAIRLKNANEKLKVLLGYVQCARAGLANESHADGLH